MKRSADSSRGVSATLFLLSSLTVGGSERKTIRLANHLASTGQSVTLAYLNEPRSLISSIDPAVQAINLQRRGKFSLKALRLLVKVIRDRNVGVVVAVNLYPSLYAVLAKRLLCKKSLRIAVSINTTEFATKSEQRQMLLYRRVLRQADRLIFGASMQRDLWCGRYKLHCGVERAVVLHNGVDTTYFDPKAVRAVSREELPRVALMFGTVGKLRREKSHLDLVKALHILRQRGLDVGALIVGDGPQRSAIDAEIDRLGLGAYFKVVGEVEDVRSWLAAVDVFVLCSTSETFSNSALEAMSMARPVVSSRVGGMAEMLQFGGGFTYHPGNVEELCKTLSVLLSDSDAREKIGTQARQIAVNRFGWERMVEEFILKVLG